MLKILNYLKAIASLIGAVGTALSAIYTDNETLTIIVVVATAVVTWAVPNIDVAEAEAETDIERDDPEYDEHTLDDVYGDEADYDYGVVYADDTEPDVSDLPVDEIHGGTGDSVPQDSWPSHDR